MVAAELGDLLGHQRVGDVEHAERNVAVAIGIGKAQLLQRPDHGVVEPALQDDADIVAVAVEHLVELVLGDELQGRRHAVLDLVFLLRIGRGRQADPAVVEVGVLDQGVARDERRLVVLGGEAAVHVAGADAELHHDRRVGDLGEVVGLLHQIDDQGQVGARVEQPHLRLHREGVAALLNDAGALAIVLAEDDQDAALDAGGGEVGERVGGDIGADRRFPHRRAAHGIVDRGAAQGGGGGLVGAAFEVNAEIAQDVAGIGEHVHEMGNRRALIAADVRNPRLQQRLGDGQDALAVKDIAVAEFEALDLLRE